MNKSHLCSCPGCGRENTVELRQAGQTLTCSGCRKEFEAPKLRELKLLPRSSPTEEPTGAKSTSPKATISGGLFAIGLGLVLVAGAAGGTLYWYASTLTPAISADEYIQSQNELIDTVQVTQLYARWEELFAQRHVPEWHESEVKSQYKQSEILKTIALGLLSVAGIGLLMTGYSLVPARRSGSTSPTN